MVVIKFQKSRKRKYYSEKFKSKVCPAAIAKFYLKGNLEISCRAAKAIAEAEIAEVYRDLVLEEEYLNLEHDIFEGTCQQVE